MKKAMIIAIGMLILIQAASVNATVLEGRTLLFNNGAPTYSGIIDANQKFEAAVNTNPNDPEANFFYAGTRLLTFALVSGSGTQIETLRDLFEKIGLTRNTIEDIRNSDQLPYSEPILNEHYDASKIAVDAETTRLFIQTRVIPLVDSALANLEKIDANFNIILTVQETGELDPIEIDYADILFFKTGLHVLKCMLHIAIAYDLSIDIPTIQQLANASMSLVPDPQFQQILDTFPNLLKQITNDGNTALLNAKASLLKAIQFYGNALEFIDMETDNQFDDLVSFDLPEDKLAAKQALAILHEFSDALHQNKPYTLLGDIEEEWILTNYSDNIFKVSMNTDPLGKTEGNEAFRIGTCGPGSIFCWGWVDTYRIDGNNVQIHMTGSGSSSSGAWCSSRLDFNGSREANKLSGLFTMENDCGDSISGWLEGLLSDQEQFQKTFDFNRIFGNSGKASLDIRSELPTFNSENEPITYPENSILDGIIDPEYSISFFRLQHRNYADGGSRNQFYFELKDQFGHYPSRKLFFEGSQLFNPNNQEISQTITSSFYWKGNSIYATYNSGTGKWDYESNFLEEVGYGGYVSSSLIPGSYSVFLNNINEKQVWEGDQSSATANYIGSVDLPIISSDSFQISWQDANLVCQWVNPAASLLPQNKTVFVRPYIEGFNEQGENVCGLYFKGPITINRISIPPEIIGKLKQAAPTFKFGARLETSDGNNRSYSNLKPISLDAPNHGTISGKVITSVAGETAGIAGATVTIVGTELSTTTNADGNFMLFGAPSGVNTLKIKADYFSEVTISNINVLQNGMTTVLAPADISALGTEGLYTQTQLDQAVLEAILAEKEKYDVDGDGIIGLFEAIRALQIAAGIHVP